MSMVLYLLWETGLRSQLIIVLANQGMKKARRLRVHGRNLSTAPMQESHRVCTPHPTPFSSQTSLITQFLSLCLLRSRSLTHIPGNCKSKFQVLKNRTESWKRKIKKVSSLAPELFGRSIICWDKAQKKISCCCEETRVLAKLWAAYFCFSQSIPSMNSSFLHFHTSPSTDLTFHTQGTILQPATPFIVFIHLISGVWEALVSSGRRLGPRLN